MSHRPSVIGAVILTFATVLAACAPTTTAPGASPTTGGQPSTPKKGGTLILARAGEVTNLDPHKVPAFTSARVFELLYSYIMRLDENLAVQPDLAESMPTLSSDGKQVTVKIRSGVKFHNGDPLTSADVNTRSTASSIRRTPPWRDRSSATSARSPRRIRPRWCST